MCILTTWKRTTHELWISLMMIIRMWISWTSVYIVRITVPHSQCKPSLSPPSAFTRVSEQIQIQIFIDIIAARKQNNLIQWARSFFKEQRTLHTTYRKKGGRRLSLLVVMDSNRGGVKHVQHVRPNRAPTKGAPTRGPASKCRII